MRLKSRETRAGARPGLVPTPQDRGHDAGTAATVYDGDYPKRLFVWRISDQILQHAHEAQGAIRQIRAAVSAMRETNGALDRPVNLVNDPVGRLRAVLADIRCYFIDVGERFRVKIITALQEPLRLASIRS